MMPSEHSTLPDNRTAETIQLIKRVAIIILYFVLALVLLGLLVYVYSQTDRMIWTIQLNSLIGHPVSDVFALKSPKVGLSVVSSSTEIEQIRRHFYPKTHLVARGKMIILYRHEPPGQWRALVFIDKDENVYAIHVGNLDSYAIELEKRKSRKRSDQVEPHSLTR